MKKVVFFILFFFCAACTRETVVSPWQFFSKQQIEPLPLKLQVRHVPLALLLQEYELLNDKQRGVLLEQLLKENNQAEDEKAEASYMLGRLYQQYLNAKDALSLFEMAKTYPALRTPALWHISEVAAICGNEKLVRETLNSLAEDEELNKTIAVQVQYALAQSYLRGSEIDRAEELFNKIRLHFPRTDYALGAEYYLASIAYAKQEKATAQITNLLKIIRAYYFDYLQVSPKGRFAQDILDKLQILGLRHHLLWSNNELAILANMHFANQRYALALENWQKAGADKYALSIASCFLKLGKMDAATQALLHAVWLHPQDGRYVEVANSLSELLSRQDARKLWQQLYNARFCRQDAVLWNLALRAPIAEALHYYQNISNKYSGSVYAPEAQWYLLWYKFRNSKSTAVNASISAAFAAAAHKYSYSRLVPRFLFWAGKIAEGFTGKADKHNAQIYYREAATLYPRDYYGQRAAMRLAAIKDGIEDNYFNPPVSLANYAEWDWPIPEQNIAELKVRQISNFELIHLKQYDEVLLQKPNIKPILLSWLYGKSGEAWTAINTAVRQLKSNSAVGGSTDKDLLLQYAYPLLYSQLIINNCRSTDNVEPFLVHALIREESRYDPHAVSRVGAIGLCQVMPGTANGIAGGLGLGGNLNNNQLFNPELNLRLGISYLSSALHTFHGDRLLTIASYNAGVNAVKNQLDGGDVLVGDADFFVENFPFRETRDYIRKVFSSYWCYRQIYRQQSGQY